MLLFIGIILFRNACKRLLLCTLYLSFMLVFARIMLHKTMTAYIQRILLEPLERIKSM